MSIYTEIQDLEHLIASCANPDTGEISEGDYEAYEALKKELTQDGLRRLAMVRANKQAFVLGLEAEIERLNAARTASIKQVDWIEGYMMTIFNETPKDKSGKVVAGTFTIGTRKSTAIEVSADFNDSRFQTIIETKKIDKRAIKEALQSGIEVQGAKLVERQNLTIK